ncbi:MAG: Na+/H+ antiporter NhaC family protein [Ndongobacter sp.]|nr:Na+/H+ antiporter NhaC family protein [Ndongobacter sp.]
MNLGELTLLVAIILFGVLAFKQVSALILAPLVTVFVLIFSALFAQQDIAILAGLKNDFMPAAAKYFSSYFLVFFLGALFGAVYQFTGAARSIAIWISSFSKGRFTASIIMVITGVLTYGGISGFVVFFVVYPIALEMFRSANLTRRLMPAAISAGCWTWSMWGPGSPSIQNVIPIESLGTTATAALIPSAIVTIATFIIIVLWFEYRSRSFNKRGLHFNDPSLKYQLTAEELNNDENTDGLPNPFLAFIPIIVILCVFNLPIFNGKGLPVETAVFTGLVLSCIMFFTHIKEGLGGWISVLNKGAADSGVSIMNTAIVVGFGGVVQHTQGFADLVSSLKTWNMPPLMFVLITVAICAGACGSASGGMGVAFDALKDTYMSMGINPMHVHRISAIAAGTLDSLPHQGAQISLLGICKLTHKEAYYDIMVTQIIIPFISCFLFMILVSMGM